MTRYKRKPKNWLEKVWFTLSKPKPIPEWQIHDHYRKYSHNKIYSYFGINSVHYNTWFEANYEAVEEKT